MADGSPGATVVVPTLNRGNYLLDTVRDLLAQTHHPLEILIVDQSDSVSLELESLVRAHPEIISHHRVKFRGLPIARNYGWQVARHDLIVYVDDDIRCGPELISRYSAELTHRSDIVGGGIEGEGEHHFGRYGAYNRWIGASRGGFGSHACGPADHVRGCSFGVRRRVFKSVAGFDERLAIGAALHEETEWMLRAGAAGHQIYFCGEIRLTHLEVKSGGTRQRDPAHYVLAFMHNRGVLTRRHSRWYQWPTCMLRSLKMTVAHAWVSRDVGVVVAGIRGTIEGWRSGGRRPRVTDWRDSSEPSSDNRPARTASRYSTGV